MTLFDEAEVLLRDALSVTAHARPVEGHRRISTGDAFVATFAVENQGLGELAATHAHTAFRDVVLRIEATPFASPVVDGEPVREVVVVFGELIFGEAASRELEMRALAALDGPEPFARVHLSGALDLQRFFSVRTVHQFTTDIRRMPALDTAAEAFRDALVERVLPAGFGVRCWSYDFDSEQGFAQVVTDPRRFRGFVRERVAELAEGRGLAAAAVTEATAPLEDAWIDVFETGYQAALALALWFVGFDHGESFDFEQVHEVARTYLEPATVYEQRRELRLIKGFDNDGVLAEPVTVVDLPVIVDFGSRTLTLWAGSLQG